LLYSLLYNLSEWISVLHVTRYITLRIILTLLTSLGITFIFYPWFIKHLTNRQINQQIRDDGPSSHLLKQGTPTMGGGLILFAVILPTFLWMDFNNHLLWLILFLTSSFGLIGFLDDYLKVIRKNPKGLGGKHKLFWQFIIAMIVVILHFFLNNEDGLVLFPFFKNWSVDFGKNYIFFAVFVIVGTSNAVNLTDGLDGLAIGPVMTTASCFVILSYVTGHSVMAEYLHYPYIEYSGELALFAASIVGAGLGFLWYNFYPAQIFMGDIGSLPLGGALGTLAVFTKHEILLVIIGGIFVVEALSVITQVVSFKARGKRVFRMAPIHHHFELKGLPEPKVIVRFWIVSIMLAMVGLMSLKLR